MCFLGGKCKVSGNVRGPQGSPPPDSHHRRHSDLCSLIMGFSFLLSRFRVTPLHCTLRFGSSCFPPAETWGSQQISRSHADLSPTSPAKALSQHQVTWGGQGPGSRKCPVEKTRSVWWGSPSLAPCKKHSPPHAFPKLKKTASATLQRWFKALAFPPLLEPEASASPKACFNSKDLCRVVMLYQWPRPKVKPQQLLAEKSRRPRGPLSHSGQPEASWKW